MLQFLVISRLIVLKYNFILAKLLSESESVAVFLYNHKSWKSQKVSQNFQSTAEYYSDENIKWFAINCAWNKCGKSFPQENLPIVQFYVKPRTRNARNTPTVMKTELFSLADMINFIHLNLNPVQFIYTKEDYQTKRQIESLSLLTSANMFISPPIKWFSILTDIENGLFEFMHDLRLFKK